MKSGSVWIPVACLIAGLGIGMAIPDRISAEFQSDAAGESPHHFSAVQVSARSASDDSRPQQKLSNQVSGFADDSSEAGEIPMVKIPVTLLEELSCAASSRVLGQDLFSGSEKIEEILGISDREKELLQSAWYRSQEDLRSLESDAMLQQEAEDGSIKVELPDLSAVSVSVGDQFRASAEGILGNDRAAAFCAIMQTDKCCNPGEGSKTLTIKPEETGDGQWRFHMTMETPAGRRVWVGDKVPEELQHMIGGLRFE